MQMEDNEMIQVSRDDLDDNDIMAYSGINVDQDESAELETGGAIMDAIENKDPSKSAPKKTNKKKKKVTKKKKEEEDEATEDSSEKKDSEEEKKPAAKLKTKT